MTDVWVPLVASMIGGVLGITASLVVFRLEQQRSAREARHDAKRVAVSRMLDVLDDAIKAQTLPPVLRRWRNPHAAVVLALSRLMLDLSKEDLAIALWAGSQVQRMTYEKAGRRYLRRATQLQSRLLMWYRGDTSILWFHNELEKEPFQDDWRPSLQVRARSELRDMAENFGTLAAATIAYVGVKESLLPLASRLLRHHVDTIRK